MTRKEEIQKQINALNVELIKINEQEREEARLKASKRMQSLKDNREFLLSLFEHSGANCSDDKPHNGIDSSESGCRCVKCGLVQLLNEDWYDGDYDVFFSATITEL